MIAPPVLSGSPATIDSTVRLAAAGVADQADELALAQVEVEVLDDDDRARRAWRRSC